VGKSLSGTQTLKKGKKKGKKKGTFRPRKKSIGKEDKLLEEQLMRHVSSGIDSQKSRNSSSIFSKTKSTPMASMLTTGGKKKKEEKKPKRKT